MPAGTAAALLGESCALDNTEGVLRATYHKRSMTGRRHSVVYDIEGRPAGDIRVMGTQGLE
jgi:hypothetical protein